jgi:hypothetical protein
VAAGLLRLRSCAEDRSAHSFECRVLPGRHAIQLIVHRGHGAIILHRYRAASASDDGEPRDGIGDSLLLRANGGAGAHALVRVQKQGSAIWSGCRVRG